MKKSTLFLTLIATVLWFSGQSQISILPQHSSKFGVEMGGDLQSHRIGLSIGAFYSYKSRILAKLRYTNIINDEIYLATYGSQITRIKYQINPEAQVNIVQPNSFKKIGLYASMGAKYKRSDSELLSEDDYYFNAHLYTKFLLKSKLTLVPELYTGISSWKYSFLKQRIWNFGGNITLDWKNGTYLNLGIGTAPAYYNLSKMQGSVKFGYRF